MKLPNLNNTPAKRNPFKVPEGYFHNLTAQVMERVSQSELEQQANEPARRKRKPFYKTELYARLKPYIYMAAMFGGIYFGIWVYKYQQRIMGEKAQTTAMQQEAETTPLSDMTDEEMEQYIDQACDYMMLDSHDIMAYVTDEGPADL